jgi:neutral ceramidase
MGSTSLMAGVGRADITPPLPADLMGYLRRAEAAVEVRMPLQATTLVVADERSCVAVVTADLVGLTVAQARGLRRAVAEAIGTGPDSVLINVSHTHGSPFTGMGGGHKLGGELRTVHDRERAYVEQLFHQIVGSAVQARARFEPARVGSATGSCALGVNRRERTAGTRGTAGVVRTILGWNPEGVCDTDVGVLRVDRADGSPLAVVVNYACHPVVVGPEDAAVNPDFPGPMRAMVESTMDTTALFLQGAGGNVLPLQGFFDHSGPEYVFGRTLAVEAIHVAWNIDTFATEIDRIAYGSVSPIALYRRRRLDPQPVQSVAAAGRDVRFPLKRVPTEEEVLAELATYREQYAEAERGGATRAELNPIDYHILWAESALRQIRDGSASIEVDAYLQALRIGDCHIGTAPGEVFSEIAVAVKEASPVGREHTLFAGYTNGSVSYLPCAAEYPFGGYEIDYAHHSYGLVEQVAPETERIIVEGNLELLAEVHGTLG